VNGAAEALTVVMANSPPSAAAARSILRIETNSFLTVILIWRLISPERGPDQGNFATFSHRRVK
jgi:hypothetical protein